VIPEIFNNKNFDVIKNKFNSYWLNEIFVISSIILIKIIFQIIISASGFMWLSSDDYCRTVKSVEWLDHPIIYSGVWLTPHFWVNGFVMIFVKNIFLAATLTNTIFSVFTIYYFYKICLIVFDKKNAVISSLIFAFFPFQVWLSLSGLPESIHFFFIIAGIYYAVEYKRTNYRTNKLVLAAIMFAFGNMFRYEGWLFTLVFLIYIFYIEFVLNLKGKRKILPLLIASISVTTIFWWLLQNYIDHKDILFFAKETNKIYEDYGGIKVLQKVIQYPVFIFYIAPITSFFAIKITYDCIRKFFKRKTDVTLISIFAFFNLGELILLMFQGLLGTGGTNMISRYIVINAILFIPLAVYQIFNFKKWIAVSIFVIIILGNILWSFNYPHPFREDTYETGRLIKDRIKREYIHNDEKVYFEEVEGYYDIYAVQTLANYPLKFVLGNFPVSEIGEVKKKKKKNQLSPEEINILDIKSYIEKNKIALAVVKSDSYAEKLRKMNFKNEEIGDYKIFYIRDIESNINDSTVNILTKNILSLKENPDVINFNKTISLKDYKIDNSNYGFNPQTVTLTFASVSKNILDSIDYENFSFDRYSSIVEIRKDDNDSLVYSESKRIFSERNIEDLIAYNEIKNIVVLKPFALIYYSKKFSSSPFESGSYNLYLKLFDSKNKRSLSVFKGDSLYKVEDRILDSLKLKGADTLKTKPKQPEKSKLINPKNYLLGSVIAFFPNTNIEKLVSGGSNFYRIITQNGLQVFFSQRYQADHFLNFVFNYF